MKARTEAIEVRPGEAQLQGIESRGKELGRPEQQELKAR